MTPETREFWETWAEEKSTREPTPAPTPVASEATEETAEPARAEKKRDRGDRGDRGRRGGRDREDRDDKKRGSSAKAEDEKPRSKRDTTVTPPPAMDATSQARLFISLGKKHGVSADDIRELLAGPIGGDKARIGSVSLRDSHAHVRVPEEHADAIIAGVNGTEHNEHSVTVERARA